ncbi:Uncharacterised protein [Mycobacteroides abscessus subsp. massiliense]|nr:Uncharacterised protein [Mycobacteroides abscessus subsp. massiliense]
MVFINFLKKLNNCNNILDRVINKHMYVLILR